MWGQSSKSSFCCLFTLKVFSGYPWKYVKVREGVYRKINTFFFFSKPECTNKWPIEHIELWLLKWCCGTAAMWTCLRTCLIWRERFEGEGGGGLCVCVCECCRPPWPHYLCTSVVVAAFLWVTPFWLTNTHSETASYINQATCLHWMSFHCLCPAHTHMHTLFLECIQHETSRLRCLLCVVVPTLLLQA